MERFNIPIVLFIFKRIDTTLRIMERISQIKPQKLYLISDGPRNEDEKEQILACRREIESKINWNCEIVQNYAVQNMGVYNRIGLGAKWVFSLEKEAIFLEDDNLPEITFFEYCRCMLEKYENDKRVLWVCGTNYLQKYEPVDGASYVFTKHLMPCGWASWANKFLEFYDGDMEIVKNNNLLKRLKFEYDDNRLYQQQLNSVLSEFQKLKYEGKPTSWDFQMAFTIRANSMYGISPKYNQIENIGVDSFSTHGGTTLENPMTKRFCSIKSYPLKFPIIHPKTVLSDIDYEIKVGKIILYPLTMRIKFTIKKFISKILKKIFNINPNESVSKKFKEKFNDYYNKESLK